MRATLMLMAAVGLLRGCSCDNTDSLRPRPPWQCADEGRRPAPGESACKDPNPRFVQDQCVADRCDKPDSSCCPGMFCTGGGECVVPPARLTLCENDGDCEAGARCLERPLIHDSKTCGFPPVNDAGECVDGGRPFNGRCLGGDAPPCGQPCPGGQVCNIDTNVCETPPALLNAGSGCDQQCGEAEVLVYSDPDSMLWDQCCAVACECLTLPPLSPGRWGRYSDMVLDSAELFVSGYDSTYGDLVMAAFDRVSGAMTEIHYIDGVPAGGAVVGDPDGPRGGRTGPGPDVGTHTAVALHDGEPRIAYYDLEAGNLKYAAYDSSTGTWMVSLVDDGRDETGEDSGDVGRYTSLTIDGRGIAHITYYAHRTLVSGELVTGPRYARALTTAPAAYEDWERIPVETVGSCNGACLAGEVCAQGGAGAACYTPRADCADVPIVEPSDDGCACDKVCVDDGGPSTCLPQLPLSLTEPCDGSCPTDFACVAEPPNGSICRRALASGCGSCTGAQVCVDDGSDNAVCRTETPYSTLEGLPEGVGLFTSAAIYQGVPTLVYYDRLLAQLRVAVANFDSDGPLSDFATWPLACDAGEDLGQQASLIVEPDGVGVLVAFQADGGKTLWAYRGDDLVTGTAQLIDDGARQGGTLSYVGASPSIAIHPSTNEAYIAYGDQTLNDLLLAYERGGLWRQVTLLEEGAYGSFANLAIDGTQAWVTTYLRARDDRDQDASRLVVYTFSLTELP